MRTEDKTSTDDRPQLELSGWDLSAVGGRRRASAKKKTCGLKKRECLLERLSVLKATREGLSAKSGEACGPGGEGGVRRGRIPRQPFICSGRRRIY